LARFTKNSISKVGGFQDQVLAEELLYGQDTYWDITVTADDGTPYDLTNWLTSARLIKRSVTAIEDTRNGLDIQGLATIPTESEISLDSNVIIYNPTQGKIRFIIDDVFFQTATSVIDSETPPVYTGYIGLQLPAIGTPGDIEYIPSLQKKICLLFIIRSDGVTL
jgi:hypothetical protein